MNRQTEKRSDISDVNCCHVTYAYRRNPSNNCGSRQLRQQFSYILQEAQEAKLEATRKDCKAQLTEDQEEISKLQQTITEVATEEVDAFYIHTY